MRILILLVLVLGTCWPATTAVAAPDSNTSPGEDDTPVKLSTAWTVVALNMIGADVLSSYIPGKQQEVIDFAGGESNVKYYMLAGAIIYEIPIGMILASRYMPRRASRWVNVGAAVLTATTIVGGGSLEPHYVFAATVEVVSLSYIVWKALTWREASDGSESRHSLSGFASPHGGQVGYVYRF